MRDHIAQTRRPTPSVSAKKEQVEHLVLDMRRQCEELSRDIDAEETRVGLHDPNHYAYPALAKALRGRRDKQNCRSKVSRKLLGQHLPVA